ncbi:MAG: L-aspartate oxidase [Thermosulfidibacteraceae bacterium]|jgi:L-aspartate oxidase
MVRDIIESDVLIIGSGVAGLTSAIFLSEIGFRVNIVTKASKPEESNTYYAQGGIIYKGENDSPDLLVKDILEAGAGASNPIAARILAELGPYLVEELLVKKLSVPFSRDESGKLDLTEEGAHSVRRIIHSDDLTGRAIEISLLNYVSKLENVKIWTEHMAIDLLNKQYHCKNPLYVYDEPECLGAYVLSIKEGVVKRFLAKATILATGGLGQIYLHTSNPKGATGDGFAMAYRAGVQLINMEYIQFHPTTLYHKESERFLISESVRGEGGVLKTPLGEPFMEKYHPLGSLAPRDVVARAIHEEMTENGYEYVLLDLVSYMDAEKIKKRFPNIYETCLKYGVDITKEPIPVVPAVHFACGGIRTNMWGETSMKRLFAVGEVACTGLHGANRLASTSLLEGLVFGYRAANRIADKWSELKKDIPLPVSWVDTGEFYPDPALINQDWNTLKHIMWNYVGLVRTEKRLKRALFDLRHLYWEIEEFYRKAKLTRSLLELRNGILIGYIIATAAYKNRESRGCHYRKDTEI